MIALVVAGDYEEYYYFLRRYGLSNRDYRYVEHSEKLRGFAASTPIILYGTWKDSQYFYREMVPLLRRFSNVIEWYWDEDGDEDAGDLPESPPGPGVKQPPPVITPNQLAKLQELEMEYLVKKYSGIKAVINRGLST